MLAFVGAMVAGIGILPVPVGAQTASEGPVRPIHVPVAGPVSFRDDFGDARDGGARTHLGNDVFAPKLTPVLAAADGRVTSIVTGTARAGNQLTLTGVDGWRYLYVHLNNDTPGTDDGANPRRWMVTPGIAVGTRVSAGQHLGYQGDSGNAEEEDPQLHFEIRTPANAAVNPYRSLVGSRGLAAGSRCALPTNPRRAADPAAGAGYRLVAADGGVFAYGDAAPLGSLGGQVLQRPIVAAATTPTGAGYWLVADDGGVSSFGDAAGRGSLRGQVLNRPIVAAAATPTGDGYWLVADDGGVFSFGDARFHGSTGAIRLSAPVTDVAATRGGGGYTLSAADGGVFTFGDARFHGSVPGTGSCGPFASAGIAATATGAGSWVVSSDGRVVPLGDAPDHGDPWREGLRPRLVDVLPLPR